MSIDIEHIGAVEPSRYDELGIKREDLVWLWKTMTLIRRFEERVVKLFEEKRLVGASHLYIGMEAIATGVMRALDKDDYVVSTYRSHGHALARGISPRLVMAELFGRATGTNKGLGGSMHASMYPELGIMLTTAIVGSGVPVAAGLGYAIKYKGEKRVVAVFFGDGAVNTGAFHEGANMIGLWRLPVIMVCENNLYGMGGRVDRVTAGSKDLSVIHRASAYGIRGIVVDGFDPVAVYVAARKAVESARRGDGPTFIEARAYRFLGHNLRDPQRYRSREEIEAWKKRDAIPRMRNILVEHGYATEEELNSIEEEILKEIENSVEFAEKSPLLSFEELYNFIYS
ncbi:MAG: thiamine pyrophosphate-dependent enzyme [Desulfurococcales archaeon]|jgi:TPP-dependent pyruvate/acetoin dehydrogenase alpha subunit|nr:thiamine pyrophosphate-dependent enzyme [Desulfurococcales archaeon]